MSRHYMRFVAMRDEARALQAEVERLREAALWLLDLNDRRLRGEPAVGLDEAWAALASAAKQAPAVVQRECSQPDR